MAAQHIGWNESTYYGRIGRNVLTNFQLGTDGLVNLLGAMALMIDGDGSSDTHYDAVTAKFGFGTNTISHQAYVDLTALLSKINTDASVTLVKTQLAQSFNKFR